MILDNLKKAHLIWSALSKEGLEKIKEEAEIIVVPENRPYLLGLKHNIPLLKKAGVKFVYCTDNCLGQLFFRNKIEKVWFFYKECRGNEGIVGVSGSLYVCILSYLHKVPIQVLPQGSINQEFNDKDSSSLDGRRFIDDRDVDNIVSAEDELVNWEVLC